MKEASARIKINKLLENAGWRFFADQNGPANIQLEPSVTLTQKALDGLGENFEKASRGFIDFLLLNEKGFPFIVLEAKAEDKNPLAGKEQARAYAQSQHCRFVILSNGNLHYFWDLERGNPTLITAFPSPGSVAGCLKTKPDPRRIIDENVKEDYVVLTQRPGYAAEAAWKNTDERARFIESNGLRFLRAYQLKAIAAIQRAIAQGNDRFLFEMATGTGKTSPRPPSSRLFLRTGNARPRAVSGGPAGAGRPGQQGLPQGAGERLQERHLQGKPRRLAQGRDCGHHRAVAAVQQQVPAPLFPHRFRSGHLRRSAPLHRRQCPRRV
jgi:type I restriction enzyme R subunit